MKGIRMKDLLMEGPKEQAAVRLLSDLVKKSRWKGKVFIAGGYVRDELLGRDPKDIDLVIEFPQGGIKFAEWVCKELGIYKKGSNPVVYPTFGTAAFKLNGIEYKGYDLSDMEIECVMTRKERYTAGSRKPDVSPGTLKDDVERRDFTVNSLLKDLSTGEILDLTGMGKADLKRGIVRTPLDPDVIFTDDPLRMLRAIRFTVKYGWDLPMFMIKAMKRNAHKLKNISSERIRDELNKMLVTKSPDKAIRLLQMTGLNKNVAPELDALKGMEQGPHHQWDAMKHSLEVLKNVPDKLEARLAALFHDIGKGATKKVIDNEIHFYTHEEVGADMVREIMKRLAYPNDIITKVVAAVKAHMRTKAWGDEANVSDKALRKLKRSLGDHLETTLDLIHADNISHSPASNMPNQIPTIRARLSDLAKDVVDEELPIDGNDVMKELGLTKGGPVIGQVLASVREHWYDNPKMTKKEALDIVRKMKKSLGL